MKSFLATIKPENHATACASSAKPIVVLGDVMLDSFIEGRVSRISPEAPVPILSNPSEGQSALGGAANVAHNLTRLGNSVRLIGGLGSDSKESFDAAGNKFLAEMSRVGIVTSGLVPLDRITTVKQRVVAGKQQLMRFDYEETAELLAEEEARVISHFDIAVEGAAAVVISDYAKGFLTKKVIDHVSATAKKLNIPLLADVKLSGLEKLSYVTVLKPNLKEAEEFTGLKYDGDESQIIAMVKNLAERFSCSVVITAGALGMYAGDPAGEVFQVKSKPVDVFDLSGAGDTSLAALAHGVLRELPFEDTVSLATISSGVVVAKRGIVPAEVSELRAELAKKIVPKFWGHEEWIVNSDYCGKKLVLNEGFCCSLHYHKVKDETFYIASGRVGFQMNDEFFILTPGDSLLITPGMKHRFYGLESSEIFEFSTHHMEEDSYRDEVSGTFDKSFFDEVPLRKTA